MIYYLGYEWEEQKCMIKKLYKEILEVLVIICVYVYYVYMVYIFYGD